METYFISSPCLISDEMGWPCASSVLKNFSRLSRGLGYTHHSRRRSPERLVSWAKFGENSSMSYGIIPLRKKSDINLGWGRISERKLPKNLRSTLSFGTGARLSCTWRLAKFVFSALAHDLEANLGFECTRRGVWSGEPGLRFQLHWNFPLFIRRVKVRLGSVPKGNLRDLWP